MADLYKANVKEDRKVLIHNDLANAAFFYKNIIVGKQAHGGEGITFDCMACATMLAFTWEAYLNYYGWELIDDWNENQSVDDKEVKVLEQLKIKPDWSKRPYDAIRTLQKIRNWLAHGVPVEETKETEVINKQEKIERRKVSVGAKWEDLCKPDIIIRAHDDLDQILKEMFTASKLGIMDTMSRVDGTISYLEKIKVGK